jgi:hypothetical protein
MIAMPATPMKSSLVDLLREASDGASVVGAWTVVDRPACRCARLSRGCCVFALHPEVHFHHPCSCKARS